MQYPPASASADGAGAVRRHHGRRHDARRRRPQGTGEVMVGGGAAAATARARPWTFYLLAALMGAFLLFLYGPMLVIYVLSFQGPNGGVTFPMVGVSHQWFAEILKPGQMANIPASFGRSVAARGHRQRAHRGDLGLGRARLPPTLPGSGVLFYLAVASLVMPSLLVGFGIGLGFQLLDCDRACSPRRLAAQLTWTLPFGLFAMFAVVDRFNRSYEEAATDLGATAWQRLRYVTLADPAARHHRRRRGRLHAVLRRICPHHADHRQLQHAAARNLRADLERNLADAVRHRHRDHGGVVRADRHRRWPWSCACNAAAPLATPES